MDGFLLEGQKGSGTLTIYEIPKFLSNVFHKLFARRGKLDDDSRSPWTSFEMVLREPLPIPPAFDFTRFLASSITFMTHLEEISVYLDSWQLVKLNKSLGSSQLYAVPRGLSCTSPNKYMTVNGLKVTRTFDVCYPMSFY